MSLQVDLNDDGVIYEEIVLYVNTLLSNHIPRGNIPSKLSSGLPLWVMYTAPSLLFSIISFLKIDFTSLI